MFTTWKFRGSCSSS